MENFTWTLKHLLYYLLYYNTDKKLCNEPPHLLLSCYTFDEYLLALRSKLDSHWPMAGKKPAFMTRCCLKERKLFFFIQIEFYFIPPGRIFLIFRNNVNIDLVKAEATHNTEALFHLKTFLITPENIDRLLKSLDSTTDYKLVWILISISINISLTFWWCNNEGFILH